MLTKYQHYIDLLLSMTEKELRARYKNTVFGFLWVIVNPLVQMLVIGFVFRFFIKEPIRNYYFYLFTGLLVWNFFTLSLTKATPSIVYERSLIKKAKFPHSVIPLSIILSNLVHLLLSFIIFLVPLLFINTLSWVRLPHFLAGLVMLIIFTAGLSLLTSALNVRFRDVNFFVQALLIIWFYATPIIYSVYVLPRSVIWMWRLNPLTAVMQLFQYALVDAPPPGWGMFTINTCLILYITVLGILIFQRESKNFDDWL